MLYYSHFSYDDVKSSFWSESYSFLCGDYRVLFRLYDFVQYRSLLVAFQGVLSCLKTHVVHRAFRGM